MVLHREAPAADLVFIGKNPDGRDLHLVVDVLIAHRILLGFVELLTTHDHRIGSSPYARSPLDHQRSNQVEERADSVDSVHSPE